MRRTALFVSAVLFTTALACGKRDTSSPSEPVTPSNPGTSSNGQNIALDSGQVDADTQVVSTSLPVHVHVTLLGAPVANATVTWTVTNGRGTVSSSTTPTDAKGAATVVWTLGDTVGINAVAAGITGASVTLSKITIAGPAASLIKVGADSSAVAAGASLSLTSRVVDRAGNAVRGATVNWTTSAGSLSAPTATTSSSGNASTNLTTSAKGTYLVTATLPGKATVSFKIVAF